MRVVKLRVVLVAAALLLTLGCQQSPGPGVSKGAPAAGSLTLRLKQEGDAALAKGDYPTAALKLQQAVNQEPAEMALRYALGTALSYLNRREDAAQEFTWVVERGAPGSQEVQMARRWLVSAGYPVVTAEPAVAAAAAEPAVAPGSYTPKNRVKGKMEWPGVTPPATLIPVHVTLVGEEPGNREFNKTRRFRLGRFYEFWDVPAGKYQLVAKAGDTVLWEQKIAVEAADKDAQFDLSAANSRVSPREFPGSRTFDD
jgi:tetratricopeptide (TPR) repeat protein